MCVKDQAQVFLGGPPLVKMGTGEVIDAESLGDAMTHATVTGLADQIAVDEYLNIAQGCFYSHAYMCLRRFDAIRKAQEGVSALYQEQLRPTLSWVAPFPPRYPVDELLSIVNPDILKPLNMLAALLRIVDDSRRSTFKPEFGPKITGMPSVFN